MDLSPPPKNNVTNFSLTFFQVRMARLQSLDLDKKIGQDGVTTAKAEEAIELTNFVLVS